MALDLTRAHCPALEAAVEEDDGEVELTLGLSIGGSSRKAPRAGAAPQGSAADAGSCEAEADLGGSGSSPSSSPPPLPFLHVDGEDALDQMRPREIHALRRREARRKRDAKKQQKRGICGAAPAAAAPGFCGVFPPLERTCSSDDRLAMDAREHQMRVKDREARVEEALDCVPNHKLGANHNPNPNADANFNPSFNPNYSNPNLVPFGAQSFPMVAMQYSYPHLQYVPITNGFGIPCVMPCWSPAMSPVAEGPRTERNVFQPVTCRAFQPFPPPVVGLTDGGLPLISKAVESDDGNGTGVERTPSWTASHGSSSSPAASDHRSGSLRGGSSSSSDRRSHSSRTQGKLQPQPSLQEGSSLPVGPSDNISSRQIDADLNAVGEPPSGRRPSPSPNRSPSANKPVRTEPPSQQASPPQLPRMPCVSATGNGPNGKKITGVLYRYTKTEVSIVCACHGSSFSPAEFVEHAGGTDVTHPLRQITVVSS